MVQRPPHSFPLKHEGKERNLSAEFCSCFSKWEKWHLEDNSEICFMSTENTPLLFFSFLFFFFLFSFAHLDALSLLHFVGLFGGLYAACVVFGKKRSHLKAVGAGA